MENVTLDVIGRLHDLCRILKQSTNKLRFVLRKRLADTVEYLKNQPATANLRPIQERLQFIEVESRQRLRIIKHWLSDYGDRALDEFIENNIFVPIRDIVIDINYNIPNYYLTRLDLLDFPSKPLTISQLHHYLGGFSWFNRNRYPEEDQDRPIIEPSVNLEIINLFNNLNYNTEENRNPDIDWSSRSD